MLSATRLEMWSMSGSAQLLRDVILLSVASLRQFSYSAAICAASSVAGWGDGAAAPLGARLDLHTPADESGQVCGLCASAEGGLTLHA